MSDNMYNNIDLIVEVECTSSDKMLGGLLLKGKRYTATKMLNIGDFKLKEDDTGNIGYYKCKYFKVTKIIKCDYSIKIGDTFT